MAVEREAFEPFVDDEFYLERRPKRARGFDARLLQEPVGVLPKRRPLTFSDSCPVTTVMLAMQRKGRGAVLITEDGSGHSPLRGILTDRDVLTRVVGHGRNPVFLPVGRVMTADPESLPADASIAWVLNRMALGPCRHVPVVNQDGHPLFVISVRDVVQLLVECFPREVLNLPPQFGADRFREREGA